MSKHRATGDQPLSNRRPKALASAQELRNGLTVLAVKSTREVPMILASPEPPGIATRKARAYSEGIRQLRLQGYTFEAIRRALSLVGVEVSNRTVQREVARSMRAAKLRATPRDENLTPRVTPSASTFAPSPTPNPSDVGGALRSAAAMAKGRNGKEIAEDYFSGLITNPFVLAKEHS